MTRISMIHVLVFLSMIINFLGPACSDDASCPYACSTTIPPPTGTGMLTSPSTAVPTPPYQTGAYYPPPAGFLPYGPPPPPLLPYQGRGSAVAPPPPNAIMPYFPYYYRKRPGERDRSQISGVGAAASLGISLWVVLAGSVIVQVLRVRLVLV